MPRTNVFNQKQALTEESMMDMFCYQCEETIQGTGCVKTGACGKTAEVANLQSYLIALTKGLAYWTTKARSLDIDVKPENRYISDMLFSTITNVNFDPDWFVRRIQEGHQLKDSVEERVKANLPTDDVADFFEKAPQEAKLQVEEHELTSSFLVAFGKTLDPTSIADEDVRSMVELVTYGLKGMAAYAWHAWVLGYEDEEVWEFIDATMAQLTNSENPLEDYIALATKVGEVGVKVMAMLDKAHTDTFGIPEPTKVTLGVQPGPAIMVSGHDLHDLQELLRQSEGTGVKIYTHGEMLPAHAYPNLKKFSHLVGNYGGAWWNQVQEIRAFNGPVLFTTNCLVPPKDDYIGRIYTTGLVGHPGTKTIPIVDGRKDFSEIIRHAQQCEQPQEIETGSVMTGFSHHSILAVADKVVGAIKEGAIKRFVVMAGCDGHRKERSYFTDVAEGLPSDTIILTAGCAKYRYNKLDLGDIGGIPRILDAGQCNDSYSLAVVALKLAEVFGKESINDLPISFDLGWYEQKAVLVLLSLLYLGVKNIRLGPTLPAFLSPKVAEFLVSSFGIKGTHTAEDDIPLLVAGA